jgi:hypothetical protein
MTAPRPRLVTRFVVAFAELVRETANPWRRTNDVARYGSMPMGKLEQVTAEAVEAGLVERHAADPDLLKLTASGMAAARGKTRS